MGNRRRAANKLINRSRRAAGKPQPIASAFGGLGAPARGFDPARFRGAVQSSLGSTPPVLRAAAAHPGAAAYRSVYSDTSKLMTNLNTQGMTRGTRSAVELAKTGKHTSRWVAGAIVGGLAINGMRNRSGRAANKVSGRPTGMYGY